MAEVDLTGRVALVTGSGGGLGRAYALNLASLGAAVLINDPGTDKTTGASLAEAVAAEIKAAGGKAAVDKNFITKDMASAEAIVKSAIDAFGKLDIIVNNAGMLIDRSFGKQSPEDWAKVLEVHLYGQRNIIKAAWAGMSAQKYGRIVNVGSLNGMRGAFGQTNYSSAKSGAVGLTKALALEGAKNNIKVNLMIPVGGSAMTATIYSEGLVKLLKPEYPALMVSFLSSSHDSVPTGRIFEGGAGYYAEWQWRRADGLHLDITKPITVHDIAKGMGTITDMSQATDPILDDEKSPKQSRQAEEILQKQQSKL